MAHQVQVQSPLPPGVPSIQLPNRLQYPAGATVVLTDDEFAMLAFDVFTNGYLIDQGVIGVSGNAAGTQSAQIFNSTVAQQQALATGTLTAGSVSWVMPFQGSSYKKFLLWLAGASTTGLTITFPTAFVHAPAIVGVAAGAETGITTGVTATTTTLTLPSYTTQTGWLIVEGF